MDFYSGCKARQSGTLINGQVFNDIIDPSGFHLFFHFLASVVEFCLVPEPGVFLHRMRELFSPDFFVGRHSIEIYHWEMFRLSVLNPLGHSDRSGIEIS